MLQVPESEEWRPDSAAHGRYQRIYYVPSAFAQLYVLQGPWVAVQGCICLVANATAPKQHQISLNVSSISVAR